MLLAGLPKTGRELQNPDARSIDPERPLGEAITGEPLRWRFLRPAPPHSPGMAP